MRGVQQTIPPAVVRFIAPYLVEIGESPEGLIERYRAWRATLPDKVRLNREAEVRRNFPGVESVDAAAVEAALRLCRK